jgi:peptidoglycan/xylan/chitin deacetylase (PgdA/CDA1 family)
MFASQWIAKKIVPIITRKFNAEMQFGILYFHRVLEKRDPFYPDDPTVRELDGLLSVLSTVFDIVSIKDALMGTESRRPQLVITFDDGYQDNINLGLPVLAKHNVQATFFVATDGIKEGVLWQDKVIESYRQGTDEGLSKIQGMTFQGKKSHRVTACQEHLSELKNLSPEIREEKIQDLLSKTNPSISRLMMTELDILTALQQGHTIGAHSVHHEILSRLTDRDARHEILESKNVLEMIIGEKVDLFCYPNGRPNIDFTKKHELMLKEAGFSAGFTTQDGGVGGSTNRYRLPRFLPYRTNKLTRTLSIAKIMGEKI